MVRLRSRLLPESQRRTLEELTDDLDLNTGDVAANRSAFWTMLLLAAVIASAGVLADSTATVIGAMIIAPLSTPIMGIALSITKRERNGATKYVIGGGLVVVLVGLCFSALLPGSYDLATNSQITGRTSPSMLDLVAALATGLAGAVAFARRDVAAILPGVAIAISLVPPLAVVGVCLGQGDAGLALGALVLFLSNLVALVLAGTAVFTTLGYRAEATTARAHSRGAAYATMAVLLILVVVPLLANSVVSYVLATWTGRVKDVASQWVASVPGATVTSVDNASTTLYVHVRTPSTVPSADDLMRRLKGKIPDGLHIVVETTLGDRIDAGTLGR